MVSLAALCFVGLSMSGMLVNPVAAAGYHFITVDIDFVYQLDAVDLYGSPADFYWKVKIGGSSYFQSPTFNNQAEVDPEPAWSCSYTVSNTIANVTIIIELWDDDSWPDGDDRCDISRKTGINSATIYYNPITLQRWGDDNYTGDSLFGHISGNDDGSLYTDQDDCWMLYDLITVDA